MRIKSLRLAGLFLAIGFLLSAIGILVVGGEKTGVALAAMVFFCASIICAMIFRAACNAEKTIKERIPWEQLKQRNELIQKRFDANGGLLLIGAGLIMWAFCAILVVVVLRDGGDISDYALGIPFGISAVVTMIVGLRKILKKA